MPDFKNIFFNDSKIAFDREHRKTINFNISKYDQAVKIGKQRYKNIKLAKISLHELLLLNRKKNVKQKNEPFLWNLGMKAYAFAFKKRKNLDALNGKMKNTALRINPRVLGNQKEFPSFVKNSFSKIRKLN